MPNLIGFEWVKCPDGYEVGNLIPDLDISGETATFFPIDTAPIWLKGKMYRNKYQEDIEPSELPDLTERFIIPKSQRLLKGNSLDDLEPGAFLELADCYKSMPNTLIFVGKHGLLNWGTRILGEIDDLYIQRVTEFQRIAKKMNLAIGLWEKSKSTNDFGEIIQWYNGGGKATSFIDFGEKERGAYSTNLRPHLRLSRERMKPPIFTFVPENLVSALWLQFAQSVSLNSTLSRCLICPTWFAYGTGTGRRKSAHYCSDKCRKAAHQRQKTKPNG